MSSNLSLAGHNFQLEAGGVITFNPAITLTIHYPPGQIATDSLRLYLWQDTVWQDAALTCTSPSTYTYGLDFVKVAICHLTEFALAGEGTSEVYLPVILKRP